MTSGNTLAKLGNALMVFGDSNDALESFREALAIMDRLTKSDPKNANWQANAAGMQNLTGDLFLQRNDKPEALKHFREALAITERIARSDPKNAALAT